MTAPSKPPLHAFAGYGVEIEYMIADRVTLGVAPVCDALFEAGGAGGADLGDWLPEGDEGPIALSNELALHVVEFKTNGPATSLRGLAAQFQRLIQRINALLAPQNGLLLPTGMHPWMDPHRETKLWPHECGAIYQAYDRIFDCRGHGWSNLQSTHLNLPFADDAEFERLHAAIRAVLPILPALTASSPIVEGAWAAAADHRLETYRKNSARIPEMAGLVVPESVRSKADYERSILNPIYAALSPHDPEGLLRFEFANSRGAIARFDRQAIEIRVLDNQEAPIADCAYLELIVAVVRDLYEARDVSLSTLQALSTEGLAQHFRAALRGAEQTVIDDAAYLKAFGWGASSASLGALWGHLRSRHTDLSEGAALDRLLTAGSLSTRLRKALPKVLSREALEAVYRELADCLHQGALFRA